MPHPHRRRHGLPPDRVRALELLADTQDGVTEAPMIAHGVTVRDPDGWANATMDHDGCRYWIKRRR